MSKLKVNCQHTYVLSLDFAHTFLKCLEQLFSLHKKVAGIAYNYFHFSETRNTQRAGKLIILPQFTFMAIPVVDFKRGGNKIQNIFAYTRSFSKELLISLEMG